MNTSTRSALATPSTADLSTMTLAEMTLHFMGAPSGHCAECAGSGEGWTLETGVGPCAACLGSGKRAR